MPSSSGADMLHEIREKPVRAGNACRKLPEEREARVNEHALAVTTHEERTARRLLSGIGHRERRTVARVPGVRVVEPALLDPAFEIRGSDRIRAGKDGVLVHLDRGG